MPFGELAAVVGQLDGSLDRLRVGQEGCNPHRGGQVRDVDVIGVIDEEPVASRDQVRNRSASAGSG